MSPLARKLTLFGLNYAPETTGIAPYAVAMARGLSMRGYATRTLTAHPHYPQWKITPGYGQWSRSEHLDGVTVTRLRHFVPSSPTPVVRALSELSFGIRQITQRWGRPDAVIAVSPALISSVVARARARVTHRNTPFVVWVQDLYGLGVEETGQGSGVASQVIRWIEGWLLRSATKVVVIHERFADRIHVDFGVPRDRIAVIRNWTHLPPLPPADVAAVRAHHGWAPDETVVVHSGNMGVKQGLQYVIEASRLAYDHGKSVRFVLVGDGSQREELQRLAAAAPASVQFVPPLDDRDFTDVLQAADVLLVNELPGVSEMALPSKLTSYFAAGRPVLAATDAGGITAQEIRAADAGAVVAAGDPQALLDGVLAMTVDGTEAARLGANGRRYRETVLNETFAIDQFDKLLSLLIDGNAAEQATRSSTTID